MTFRSYAVKAGAKAIRISTFVTPEGKFAQFLISAEPGQ
jgi:hypothetical protein